MDKIPEVPITGQPVRKKTKHFFVTDSTANRPVSRDQYQQQEVQASQQAKSLRPSDLLFSEKAPAPIHDGSSDTQQSESSYLGSSQFNLQKRKLQLSPSDSSSSSSDDDSDTESTISTFPTNTFQDLEVTPADPEKFQGFVDPENGRRKLTKIRDLKPQDIARENRASEEAYEERYVTKPGERRSDGYYKIRTFVRKDLEGSQLQPIDYHYLNACYMGHINPEKGVILIEGAFRDIVSKKYKSEIEASPGRYDKYAKYRETEPLNCSKILYNWIRKTEAKSKIPFQSEIKAIKVCDVVHESFVHAQDYIHPVGGIKYREIDGKQIGRMVFKKGDKGFAAIMEHSISNQVEYLGVHQLNIEVTEIVFDRVKRPGKRDKYNVIYKYGPIDTTG